MSSDSKLASADLSLIDTPDGLQVLFDGRALYDNRPASSAANKARSLPLQEQTLYLVPSPVAWHGVAELMSRLPHGSAILAVESDPVLFELARRLLPADLSDSNLMLCLADASAVRSALENSVTGGPGLSRFRRVREISFCRGALLSRSRYRKVREELEQEIRIIWQNRLTLSAMGRLWIGNMIRNLPSLMEFAELPALHGAVVVCGAGPSLSASIPLLRRKRRHLTIVAVDTALPSLVQNNVMPDFVVAIEGQLANVYDFLPVARRDYTLVADLGSAPAVIELHQPGRIVWVSSRFAEIGLLDRISESGLPLKTIPALGSVGVVAAEIALTLTDGAVLLTGLDFAFRATMSDSDGHAAYSQNDTTLSTTHSAGAPVHLSRLILDQRLHRAPPPQYAGRWMARRGVDGRPAATTLPMIGYAEQLESLIASDSETQGDRTALPRPIVAVEPFGLYTGARSVTIGQAVELINRSEVGSFADAEEREANGRGQRRPHLKRISHLLSNELELLDRLDTLVKAALTGNQSNELWRAFEVCNYVVVDFPDFTGEFETNQGFLTRVRVAIDFYRDRLHRSIKSLRP